MNPHLKKWSCGYRLRLMKYLFLFLLAPYLWAQSPGNAVKVGDSTCLDCHEDEAAAITPTIHWTSPQMEEGFICESCHGPGSVHAETEEATSIYNPRTDFMEVEGNKCLDCHTGEQFGSLQGVAHYEMENGCSSCHTVHSTSEHLLVKSSRELCKDCHQEVVGQFQLASHHPVPEGLMECVSCHQVHGGNNAFATTEGTRELCLSCHSSKEGPFVFEHEPVNEDCNICHTPHGAVANALLVQNEPALCMNCHYMHFHSSLTGYEGTVFSETPGEFFEPLHPNRTGVSSLDAWKKAFTTKCTQCHQQVHGSDLPSQGVSSMGRSLTR